MKVDMPLNKEVKVNQIRLFGYARLQMYFLNIQ